MKISKLLLLAVFASSLCIVSSAFGQPCVSELSDSAFPNGGEYYLGETINYELCVGVPASDGTTYCTLTEVYVYFYPPGQEPAGVNACDDPASDPNAVLIDYIASLEPNDVYCYDGNDNSALDYPIGETACDANGTVIAYMSVTFELEGEPDCDRKTITNTVLPVYTPPCNIIGPTEVCEGSEEEIYCSEYEADGYLWWVTGDAEIVGPNDANCVVVDPNFGGGGYTVNLFICNDNGGEGCCADCNLPVTVLEAPDCLIVGPNSVCDSDSAVVFCSDVNDADSYYWEIISGDATISGSDILDCVTVIPGTSSQFELKLSIGYHDPNCYDSCTKVVDVIESPDCTINGPNNVCVDSNTVYCSDADADGYLWEIIGDGVIVGPNDTNCVTVSVGPTGSFMLYLMVCNIADTNDCCNTCELEVLIEECGGGYCTFTQGFYGNEGGTACGGLTTTEIINAVIGDGVFVGARGLDVNDVNGPSIEFYSAACIIERLPCGGKPRPLPDDLGNVDCNDQTALKDAKLLKNKKDDRITNTLVGQTVALTLNLRLHTIPCEDANGFDLGLGDYTFPEADYICVQQEEDGCIYRYAIPESLQGIPAWVALDMANEALAGAKELVESCSMNAGPLLLARISTKSATTTVTMTLMVMWIVTTRTAQIFLLVLISLVISKNTKTVFLLK